MTTPLVLIIGCGDYIGAAIASSALPLAAYCVHGAAQWRQTGTADRRDSPTPVAAHTAIRWMRANEDSCQNIFARVEAEVGALDLVICNVGGNVQFALRDTTARGVPQGWEMACFAGFLAGREAANHMVQGDVVQSF